MAVLTAAGIDFGGANGSVVSKYFLVPQSDAMLFIQSAAPTGWTRVAQNDKALRVVNAGGSGGTAGGTNAFSNTFTAQTFSANVPVSINAISMTATTIDINTMVSHSHSLNAGGAETRNGPNPAQGQSQGTTSSPTTGNNTANGGAHSHPVTFTSANGPGAAPVSMAIQYVDCNICTLN
jgi:hypothetical protein